MKVVVASGNEGKIREVRLALGKSGIELATQGELGIEPADEIHATFVENSLAKARHVAQASGLPAIADDSGICVDVLGGAPGVRSARYSGPDADDEANLELLLREMEGHGNRNAHYHASMVFVRNVQDPAPIIAEGIWRGLVTRERHGTGGFGYDPVFFDPVSGKTGAQMEIGEKNRVSHRGKALAALVKGLEEHGIRTS